MSGVSLHWSEAQLKARESRDENPSQFYYRFNKPGEEPRRGPWTKEEEKHFLDRYQELKEQGLFEGPSNNVWGTFAKELPGRVGYQCNSFYRKLIARGVLADPQYRVVNGKAVFLKNGKLPKPSKRGRGKRGDAESARKKKRAATASSALSVAERAPSERSLRLRRQTSEKIRNYAEADMSSSDDGMSSSEEDWGEPNGLALEPHLAVPAAPSSNAPNLQKRSYATDDSGDDDVADVAERELDEDDTHRWGGRRMGKARFDAECHMEISPEEFAYVSELCAHCGSAASVGEASSTAVRCTECAVVYHTFCLDSFLRKAALDEEHVHGWRCSSCRVCSACSSVMVENKLIVCDKCNKVWHTFCVKPPQRYVPERWLCSDCNRCDMCENSAYDWGEDYTLCAGCSNHHFSGSTCPICSKKCDYFESALLCRSCGRWVHTFCDKGALSNPSKMAEYSCTYCQERDSRPSPGQECPVNVTELAVVDSGSPHSGRGDGPAHLWRDNRRCRLCEGVGDKREDGQGRLIPIGRCKGMSGWVHSNCLLWSDHVRQGMDGKIHHGIEALERHMSCECTVCGEGGATVSCRAGGCALRFHIRCAAAAGGVMVVRPEGDGEFTPPVSSDTPTSNERGEPHGEPGATVSIASNTGRGDVEPMKLDPGSPYSVATAATPPMDGAPLNSASCSHLETQGKGSIRNHQRIHFCHAHTGLAPKDVGLRVSNPRLVCEDDVAGVPNLPSRLRVVLATGSKTEEKRDPSQGKPCERIGNGSITAADHVSPAVSCYPSESADLPEGRAVLAPAPVTDEAPAPTVTPSSDRHWTSQLASPALANTLPSPACAYPVNGPVRPEPMLNHLSDGHRTPPPHLADASTAGASMSDDIEAPRSTCKDTSEARALVSSISEEPNPDISANLLPKGKTLAPLIAAEKFIDGTVSISWITDAHSTCSAGEENGCTGVIECLGGSRFTRLGGLVVQRLGKVLPTLPRFHTKWNIFPLGYRAIRLFWSVADPTKLCMYRCEIGRVGSMPVFSVTPNIPELDEDDARAKPCSGDTPEDAWSALLARLPRKVASLNSGSYYFGLTNEWVCSQIAKLPGAEHCALYEPSSVTHISERNFFYHPGRNASGCARTEPFRKKDPFIKYNYGVPAGQYKLQHQLELAKRTSARRTGSRTRIPCMLPPVQSFTEATKLSYSASEFAELQKELTTQLQCRRSPIHDYGVFALVPILRGEMISEYVGEKIREPIADIREMYFEKKGIGCYMFRLDKDYIVDSTYKGNVARMMNHSCSPNSDARVVSVEGEKRIVFYAIRDIAANEELSYDYKFPYEDVKIPCHCGSEACAGYLN